MAFMLLCQKREMKIILTFIVVDSFSNAQIFTREKFYHDINLNSFFSAQENMFLFILRRLERIADTTIVRKKIYLSMGFLLEKITICDFN